jgi:hypothetical protein
MTTTNNINNNDNHSNVIMTDEDHYRYWEEVWTFWIEVSIDLMHTLE